MLQALTSVPNWTGVVMIERPDPTRTAHMVLSDGPMCAVRSARSIAYNGKRAIVCALPLSMLQHYFTTSDGDHVFAWAELHGDHLELKERACLKDWVETASIGAPALN